MSRLVDPAEQARRRAMLDRPHMAPLALLTAELRGRFGEVPEPDPLDGGATARLLLLLETPGPRVRATGFISLDNPSGTSRNLAAFLAGAGIFRSEILLWNAVPWIIHDPGATNRAPRRGEIAAGIALLPALLAVMPNLAVVVLAGRIASGAEGIPGATRPEVPVLRMAHPSPTIQCTSPDVPARCRATLAEAARILAETRRRAA